MSLPVLTVLFEAKVESSKTRGLFLQLTCLLMIAISRFCKQQKHGAPMIPVCSLQSGIF